MSFVLFLFLDCIVDFNRWIFVSVRRAVSIFMNPLEKNTGATTAFPCTSSSQNAYLFSVGDALSSTWGETNTTWRTLFCEPSLTASPTPLITELQVPLSAAKAKSLIEYEILCSTIHTSVHIYRDTQMRESIQGEQRGEKRDGEEREKVKLVLNCGNWSGRKREEDMERKWRGVVVIMFRVLRPVDGSIQSWLGSVQRSKCCLSSSWIGWGHGA